MRTKLSGTHRKATTNKKSNQHTIKFTWWRKYMGRTLSAIICRLEAGVSLDRVVSRTTRLSTSPNTPPVTITISAHMDLRRSMDGVSSETLNAPRHRRLRTGCVHRRERVCLPQSRARLQAPPNAAIRPARTDQPRRNHQRQRESSAHACCGQPPTQTARHNQPQKDTKRHRKTQTDRHRQKQTDTDRHQQTQTDNNKTAKMRTKLPKNAIPPRSALWRGCRWAHRRFCWRATRQER